MLARVRAAARKGSGVGGAGHGSFPSKEQTGILAQVSVPHRLPEGGKKLECKTISSRCDRQVHPQVEGREEWRRARDRKNRSLEVGEF